MSVKEKRSRPESTQLDIDLLEQGISQLKSEIKTLEQWLSDPATTQDAPRRSYEDMLRTRRDMLLSLEQQLVQLKQDQT